MFVSVAIPRSAPHALTYSVPEQLRPLVVVGGRVRVPVRSRSATGVVVEVSPDTPLDEAKLKGIDEVLDLEPVLPGHLLELARFAAGYYRCPLGDTLASMLPAGLLRSDAEKVELTTRGVGVDLEPLPPTQAKIIATLRETQRMNLAALMARAGFSSRGPLQALDQAGLVRIRRQRRDRAPRTEVTAIRLAEGARLEELLEQCRRSPRQRQVVEWLGVQGRPALVSEVCTAVGCSQGVVRALAERGLVERFSQARASRPRWALRADEGRPRLTDEQRTAVDAVIEVVSSRSFSALVLHGVTGSGKTEVYLRCLETVLEQGRSGLVLVPEIGLTPAASGAVERRFGERVAVLHSAQSEGERWREWRRVRDGGVRIVVGPRSALFAPVTELGLIVVDEEHDGAYKQNETPRYHARDLALVLGQRVAAPVLLCSATPSSESFSLLHRDMATPLRLTHRVAGGSLPSVELVDLRGEPPEPGEQGRTLFSRRLREVMTETVERGEQVILLIQRRGWAPVLLCRDCGHRVECRSCSVALVVHRRSCDLRCHYCGHREQVPEQCPSCGGDLLDAVGAGTEKVAHHLARLFPDVEAAILDRDTVRRRSGLEDTLGAFAAGRAQVLVGTQMVAKGHHFPNVTLTGVISADSLLGLPDFRAGERTFQLLTQVAGRAGRGARPGHVIIQTYYPDHSAVRHAKNHDVDAFMSEEMVFRQAFHYPPTVRMALVRLEAASEAAVRRAAEAVAQAAGGGAGAVRSRGPAPCPIERVRSLWRWQILLTADTRAPLREALDLVDAVKLPKSVHRITDVDPVSTL